MIFDTNLNRKTLFPIFYNSFIKQVLKKRIAWFQDIKNASHRDKESFEQKSTDK